MSASQADPTGGLGNIAGALISAGASIYGGGQANSSNQGSNLLTNWVNWNSARDATASNIEQAQQTRNFMDTELGKEQLFAQNQADAQRAWSGWEAAIARDFNATEAGRARAFADNQLHTAINANSMRAEEQQRYEAAQAQINRNFQWEMSSSAYRRMVDDMRAAGLNPILGVNSGGAAGAPGSMPSVGLPVTGSGAAPGAASIGIPSGPGASSPGIGTPSSAQAVISHLSPAHVVDVIGPAVSNALQAYRGISEVARFDSETRNLDADTMNKALQGSFIKSSTNEKDASTATLLEEARLKGWNMKEVQQHIENLKAERELTLTNIPRSKAEIEELLTRSGKNVQEGLTARSVEKRNQAETEFLGDFGKPGMFMSDITSAGSTIASFLKRLLGVNSK